MDQTGMLNRIVNAIVGKKKTHRSWTLAVSGRAMPVTRMIVVEALRLTSGNSVNFHGFVGFGLRGIDDGL